MEPLQDLWRDDPGDPAVGSPPEPGAWPDPPAPDVPPTDPAATPDEGKPRRRRRTLIAAAVVAALGGAAISPISPISPFGGSGPDDAGGERRSAPTTTMPAPTMSTTAPPSTTAAPTTTAPAPTTPPPPPAPPPPTPPFPGYQLVFDEGFDAAALSSGVWAAGVGGHEAPAAGNGVVTLTTADPNGEGALLDSIGLRSNGEPSHPQLRSWQYGYFEARLRYSDNPWSWPAFWLYSSARVEAMPGEDCSRLTSEWDIMENGIESSWAPRPASHFFYTALHRNTTDNTADGHCGIPDEQRGFGSEVPGANLADWHTWGGRWTPDQVCTYLDGVELGCMPTYDSTSQPMHLVFSMKYLGWCPSCPAQPPSLEMQIDWVRVWQQG